MLPDSRVQAAGNEHIQIGPFLRAHDAGQRRRDAALDVALLLEPHDDRLRLGVERTGHVDVGAELLQRRLQIGDKLPVDQPGCRAAGERAETSEPAEAMHRRCRSHSPCCARSAGVAAACVAAAAAPQRKLAAIAHRLDRRSSLRCRTKRSRQSSRLRCALDHRFAAHTPELAAERRRSVCGLLEASPIRRVRSARLVDATARFRNIAARRPPSRPSLRRPRR
jgi:hypothetical protein